MSSPVRFRVSAFAVVLTLAFAALGAMSAQAVESPTTGDLFDVSRGATVTSNSSVLFDVVSLLGGTATGPEPGTMFFSDAPDGTIHFVEWSTATPVALEGFNLHAVGDLPGLPEKRAFDHFRLQAKVGDNFETLYDEDVTVPYVFLDGQTGLVISAPVTPTTAQEFRAEFTQHLEGSFFGPRVIELDGFPAALCADANYNNSVSASDALTILKASVGSAGCARCVCDIDGNASVTASDALASLRISVGSSVTRSCPACFIHGTTTTTNAPPTTYTTHLSTTSSTTTTTLAPPTTVGPTTTLGGSITTTTTDTTTTTTVPAVDCDIDVAECTTNACSCGIPGLDYHLGANGDANGPVGAEVRLNINAPQGGTIDCGGWTRIFGATVTGCDTIGCCRRENGQPESTHWSVFEAIDLPCMCPSAPGPLSHNYVAQCQLRPGAVKEVFATTTPCS